MDVARLDFFSKGRAVSSVTRKTSCSSGWLRLVLQTAFAVVTVASFILIVIMSVKNAYPAPVVNPTVPSRCRVQGCRVHCKEAPYFDRFEDDIIHAIMEANIECNWVYLELQKPFFTNSLLPHTWLSRLRREVHVLSIIGGNLMHITSDVFMAQVMGSVKSLVLQDITIKTFESNSLPGLSSIQAFNIIDCKIFDVQPNVLRAIDDTLETLTITKSGEWDPTGFTGSRGFQQLAVVDFSYNNFGQILNNHSLVGLVKTKILYLNFCRITSIGPGTFDHLRSMEVLYLNNNMLSTVPPGLFNTIAALENPRPRINVQSNYWYCDCLADDLRMLVSKELLLVEVECKYPERFNSMSFTEFNHICNNDGENTMLEINNSSDIVEPSEAYENQLYAKSLYIDGQDCGSNFMRNALRLVSPEKENQCSSKKLINLNLFQEINRDGQSSINNRSHWLRFSYFIQTESFSVLQIKAIKIIKYYGLVWYQSICPQEIYCLDVLPQQLKLYSVVPNARYVFCPIYMKNGSVQNDDCIDFSFEKYTKTSDKMKYKFSIALYIITILLCLCFGALVVYGLIRRNPTLLKGSKRILFVKHKGVDALVLPPKIPLREDFIDPKDKEVFTLTTSHNNKLKLPAVKRAKSVRSVKSGSPSYISAMQPTEDQLAEWRIKHHFNNDITMSSMKSESSVLSWIDTSYCYYSLDESDRTYESLK